MLTTPACPPADRVQKLKDAQAEAAKEIDEYKKAKEQEFRAFEASVRDIPSRLLRPGRRRANRALARGHDVHDAGRAGQGDRGQARGDRRRVQCEEGRRREHPPAARDPGQPAAQPQSQETAGVITRTRSVHAGRIKTLSEFVSRRRGWRNDVTI